MKQSIALLLSHLFFLGFGVGNEYFVFRNAKYIPSSDLLQREDWITKGNGKDIDYKYVKEIQVYLGKEADKSLLKGPKDFYIENPAHFTLLTTGDLIQHAAIDQVVLSSKNDLKQVLRDQYLIYINVAEDKLALDKKKIIHRLINEIREKVPNICVKWCSFDISILIPWIEDRNCSQYSENIDAFKAFSLSQCSSEIDKIESNSVYWVPSMNHYFREDRVPKILNIFRTGKTTEKTFVNYLDKNKKTSAHFTISEDGQIFQHISLDKIAYFVTPCYGALKVGNELSSEQIVIGLSGGFESDVTENQQRFLLSLAHFLSHKYGIKNWTTPLPATKDAFVLGKELLPDLERLEGVHLTPDPKLATARSLIYHYPSPNCSDRPKDQVIDTVVLHHTFGSWDQTLISFSKEGISAHFTINQDGMIVQHVPLNVKAWHAGVSKDRRGIENVNLFSIGIELVNTGDCKDHYTDEQVGTLLVLLHDLKNILGENLHQITSHEYVALPKGRKNDPLGFPWEKLKEFEAFIVRNPDEDVLNLLFSKMCD